jgi:Fe-S-cluster containining protein
MTQYVYQTGDGRILFNKPKDGACRFLGKDNRCTIWKDRPQICDDFPYMVSMLMSRVYLAITNPEVDIMKLIEYMDDTWPCTRDIKERIVGLVEEGRKRRNFAEN